MGPVSAWMGDRLRAGRLSRYVNCNPGQLSLAIPQCAMSIGLSWEGNRRSGVALAMRHNNSLSTYGLNGLSTCPFGLRPSVCPFVRPSVTNL